MNKRFIKTTIIFILLIIGLGKYLPIFHFPVFLNNLYFNYGLLIMIISYILIGYCLFIWKMNISIKIFSVAIVILVLLFSSEIHDWNNKLIIKYNRNPNILKNPILGVKLDTLNSKLGTGVFLFNNKFGLYDALIYSPNHGLNMNTWEIKNEESYHKIYNNDWWWYKHVD